MGDDSPGAGLKGVIFDLGGVVLDSPHRIVREYEAELHLAPLAIGHLIQESGPEGAWANLERGRLQVSDFYDAFDEEARAAGLRLDARELMRRLSNGLAIRPRVLRVIREVRAAGYRTAALTNNWVDRTPVYRRMERLRREFDAFIESALLGLRKPEPAIYEAALSALGTAAEETVFLDDSGHNLKPARAMGFTTIKVTEIEAALLDLDDVLSSHGRFGSPSTFSDATAPGAGP